MGSSIRSLLASAKQLNLKVHQTDISTVFWKSKLEEEMYMTQPDGYVKEGTKT